MSSPSQTHEGAATQTASPRKEEPQKYPKGTRVVEISGGRQFVSRPLDNRHMSPRLPNVVSQINRPDHHLYQSSFGPLSNNEAARLLEASCPFPQSSGRPSSHPPLLGTINNGRSLNAHNILGINQTPTESRSPLQTLPSPQALFLQKLSSGRLQPSSAPFMKLLESTGHSPHQRATPSVFELLSRAMSGDPKGQRRHQGEPKGIQWLFDAATAVQKSPWKPKTDRASSLFPLVPSSSRDDPWTFNRAEDIVDDANLFRREELQRRRHPRYLAKTKRLHDLHIVLPICIPDGKIVIEDPLGANFYTFSDPNLEGAEILFGKGVVDTPKMSVKNEEQQENEKPSPSGTSKAGITPVCDVWASFLHVRLGTIYNLSPNHMAIVADVFRKSFDHDLCNFYVPIALDCRGVHPSSDDLISQRATRPTQLIRESRDGKKSAAERYETHAVPTSENDVKRLLMLRRHLRKFALRLIHDLGLDAGTVSHGSDHPLHTAMRLANEQPKPCIELHDNCRAATLVSDSLKIVVREWAPLSDTEVFKRVWVGELASPEHCAASGIATDVRAKVFQQKTIPSARVVTGEIRLEHNHLRMVDLRWPEELVPGRRVADQCPDSESPGPEESQARFVFCNRVPKPKVQYAYVEKDNPDPRDAVLNCRLSALFKVHLARHPTAGVSALSRASTTAVSASHTPERTGTSTPNEQTTETTPEASAKLRADENATESAEKAKQPEPTCDSQQKPITSLSQLKTIPEAFIPVLPESRSMSAMDKHEMPQILQQMLHQASEAEKMVSDQSAFKADSTFKVPLTTVACKFFLKGGCARSSECYFLHPADPKLESKADVRHIVPKHPKFF